MFIRGAHQPARTPCELFSSSGISDFGPDFSDQREKEKSVPEILSIPIGTVGSMHTRTDISKLLLLSSVQSDRQCFDLDLVCLLV